jgi:transcriptional regulator with XRE-family HTH domain
MIDQTSQLALERFTRFGDLLKFLRRRSGITQRELAARVGYSHAQISRLELNQRLPDLAMVAAQFIPALDLEQEPLVARRLLELAAETAVEEAPVEGPIPYKGLQSFDEADASLFFGRAALTSRLVERIHAALSAAPDLRFLAVVGASGGKILIRRRDCFGHPAFVHPVSVSTASTPTDRPRRPRQPDREGI